MTTDHTITQGSSDYLDARIQDKQQQILIAKQRLVRLQIELAQMKKRKASMRSVGGFREQLREVMRPG